MDRKEIFANAVGALLAQKLRSALAVLGIVVGIGALVAMVALFVWSTRQKRSNGEWTKRAKCCATTAA